MKVSELKTDMDSRFSELKTDIDARFSEFKTEMDARFGKVDDRLEGIETRLDSMDDRIGDEAKNTRRHFDVVAEDLKSQMKAAADASTQHARHLASISSENVTLLSALSDHELRLRVLERASGNSDF